MQKRLNQFFVVAILFSSLGANATSLPAITYTAAPELASAKARGNATMRFFGLKVYDITLHTKEGAALSADRYAPAQPSFALELVYDLALKGAEIAKRSVEEMRKQGYSDEAKLAKWLKTMTEVFPDIKQGDTLIGVLTADKHTHFFNREKLIAKVADPEFSAAFFDIWLGAKSSEPKLREKLFANQVKAK